MARIRSVHPGLFTDEVFMELEPQAQIFMIGLWTEADDQGVFPWKPKTLKARLLPASTADAAVLLEELRAAGVILRYEVDGVPYGAIRNFRRFQRPEKPKALHPITEAVAAFTELDEALERARIAKHKVRLDVSSWGWSRLRDEVLRRDGYACVYCGAERETDAPLECDHVLPRVRGGASTLNNLVTACRRCNRSKGAGAAPRWRLDS